MSSPSVSRPKRQAPLWVIPAVIFTVLLGMAAMDTGMFGLLGPHGGHRVSEETVEDPRLADGVAPQAPTYCETLEKELATVWDLEVSDEPRAPAVAGTSCETRADRGEREDAVVFGVSTFYAGAGEADAFYAAVDRGETPSECTLAAYVKGKQPPDEVYDETTAGVEYCVYPFSHYNGTASFTRTGQLVEISYRFHPESIPPQEFEWLRGQVVAALVEESTA